MAELRGWKSCKRSYEDRGSDDWVNVNAFSELTGICLNVQVVCNLVMSGNKTVTSGNKTVMSGNKTVTSGSKTVMSGNSSCGHNVGL